MKRSAGPAVLFALAASLVAAESDPKDQVAAAAKQLAELGNYTWKTTVVVPEGSRFPPGPTEGKTDKGLTYVSMRFGEMKMQAVIKGDQAAVTGRDGQWQSAEEMEDTPGPARWVHNFKLPPAQAMGVLGHTKGLRKEGDVYTGALTEEGVKALATFRRRAGGDGPEMSHPSGQAKFWVVDGVLTKYEFHVKGSITFNGNEIEVDRTTTTEFRDVGKTEVQVPEEALKKLS